MVEYRQRFRSLEAAQEQLAAQQQRQVVGLEARLAESDLQRRALEERCGELEGRLVRAQKALEEAVVDVRRREDEVLELQRLV